jgi:hypothetical protein
VKSSNAYLISVTLPYGAQPGTNRLFLGAAKDFPPALVTYLQGNGWDPVGGFIAYSDSPTPNVDTQYTFLVEAVAFPGEFPAGWVFGSFDSPLFQTQLLTDGATVFVSPFGEGIQLSVGNAGGAGSILIDTGGVITIKPDPGIDVVSGGSIAIEPGGLIRVSGAVLIGTGADIEVESGGFIQVDSGAHIVYEPGSFAEFDSGSVFQVDAGASAKFDAIESPRSYYQLKNDVSSATVNNGAGFGALIFDPGSHTYRDGRAYEVTVSGHWTGTVAGTTVQVQLTNGSGGVIATPKQLNFPLAGVGEVKEVRFRFRRAVGAGDQSTGLVIKGSAAGGNVTLTNSSASCPRELFVQDIGSAADWSYLPTV